MENGAHSPDWSPDGRQIAFLSPLTADERAAEAADKEPPPEPRDKLESKQRKERQAEDERNRWDPRPMWRIPYRQGTSYVDERYDQVYMIDTAESDDSKPRRLTNLNASYSQPRWSAEGDSIYSDRTTIPEATNPGAPRISSGWMRIGRRKRLDQRRVQRLRAKSIAGWQVDRLWSRSHRPHRYA